MPFAPLAAAIVPMTSSWPFEAKRLLCTRLASLLFVLLTLANPAWSHPDLEAQIEDLTAKLQQQPADPGLLAQRGDLYRRHADYIAATQDFATARAIRPEFPELDFYQGRLRLETGDAAAAEGLFTHYLASHPEHAGAWALRGQARLGLEQAEAAAEDYAQAIRRSTNPSPSLYRLQILALVAAGEEHWRAARQVVDAGLERFPREVSLLGLGTDIALAENFPVIATSYIETLPAALIELDRWQSRLELRRCLSEKLPGAEISKPACLQEAINTLRGNLGNLGSVRNLGSE
jgi:tetratricopeptide (TPR) repeat protein